MKIANYLETKEVQELINQLKEPILGYPSEILKTKHTLDLILEQSQSKLLSKKLIWSQLPKDQKILDFLYGLTSEELELLADTRVQEAIEKISCAVWLGCPDFTRSVAEEINQLVCEYPDSKSAKKLIWISCENQKRDKFTQLLKAEPLTPPPPIEVGSKVKCSWHPDWGLLEVTRITPWEHDQNKLLYWVKLPDNSGREMFYFKDYLTVTEA